ncbi:xylulokinase [Ferviditalea candida]|uniref:FGGY family carbohydrate kinase n=1 Tax=Ferviditalea candida TaxID=3108399 RepID=A0ABU5ZDH6_9BACL|nr:FGGY family carbohydrate kinase [Paenibacillaceae bacterium T2]
MSYIASFDIGTTNVKGILLSKDLSVQHEISLPLQVNEKNGRIEQNPDDWLESVYQIVQQWLSSGVRMNDIRLISFCGQMQDLIALDSGLCPVRPAILYSDGRAEEEAKEIINTVGRKRIEEITANPFNGTQPLAKLLWLKKHEPESFKRIKHVLISAKDYVIAKLTRQTVTDPTSASTAGCMDIRTYDWDADLIEDIGLNENLFAGIVAAGEAAGFIHEEVASVSGLPAGTPVLCGLGDAGAAALGAGVYSGKRTSIYLGTTGWVAKVSDKCGSTETGMFFLAFNQPDLYLSIAPILNAGNVFSWAAEVFGASAETHADPDYALFEQMLLEGLSKPNQLLFLPYLNGERCPVQDMKASGCYVGIKTSTTKEDLGAAALEGVAMSIRQVMEVLMKLEHERPREVIVTGGGAKSKAWCQLLSDMLNVNVKSPIQSPYLPVIGAALLGFAKVGWGERLPELVERFLEMTPYDLFQPSADKSSYYQEKYDAYRKLYPALAAIWNK